jgi:hypothetical protein
MVTIGSLFRDIHAHYGEKWISFSKRENCKKIISDFFKNYSSNPPIVAYINTNNMYFRDIKKALEEYNGEKRIKYSDNKSGKTFIVKNSGEAPAVLVAANETAYDGQFLFKFHTEILGKELIKKFDSLENKVQISPANCN